MIQRIQTLYLLIASVLMIITAWNPLAGWYNQEGGLLVWDTFGLAQSGEKGEIILSTWPLFTLLAVGSVASMSTIFLFRSRILQWRITIFNALLMIGFYIAATIYYFQINGKLDGYFFHLEWVSVLPLISLVLAYLAARSIWADETAVRAADRIRPSRRR